MQTVRAIDTGYGYTKYVASIAGTKLRCECFPSIAPLAGRKQLAEALGQRRNTIEVEVDGLSYEVGPDAALAQGAFVGRNMDDDYCTSPQYLALTRGALYFMEVEQIDLLVVGLPVSTFLSKRDVLRNLLLGEHQIANRNVLVRDVLVLSQPHGALGTYGLANGMFKRIRKQTSLIIDCGARTFDWLVAKGFQTVEQRSRAVNRGMLDVLEAIAEQIEVELGVPLRDLDKIDRALRFNSAPVIMQRRIELQPYMARATAIARDAVHALRRRVESAADIDNIIVAGGGAFFFKPFIAAAFPHHHIQELPDAIMANVKGFQLFGMEVAASRQSAAACAHAEAAA
jgi:plasmid segregation protein ParM